MANTGGKRKPGPPRAAGAASGRGTEPKGSSSWATRARVRLGQLGEEMAQRFLERQGLVILGRNVRTPGGELDIVAQDGPTVIFVEVRSRRSRTFGRPQESITAAKRRHLLESAQWFLQERGLDNAPWRVDLITLELMPEGQGPYLEHIPNAVQG